MVGSEALVRYGRASTDHRATKSENLSCHKGVFGGDSFLKFYFFVAILCHYFPMLHGNFHDVVLIQQNRFLDVLNVSTN